MRPCHQCVSRTLTAVRVQRVGVPGNAQDDAPATIKPPAEPRTFERLQPMSAPAFSKPKMLTTSYSMATASGIQVVEYREGQSVRKE